MAKIVVDFSKKKGKIKPMHGVGQAPFGGVNFSKFHFLTEAGIPYSRLHDVGGYLGQGRFVDIPNIFRDFNANPEDPDAYDFTFTDLLITALIDSGVEPFFRLGVTIENDCLIKAYRIYPPEDSLKWAKICEGIIKHYTQGWADGFYYNINYWEIWNEPDNYEEIMENQMWRGTKEQFYELYGVASKYLKERFPHLKIGGYASCGFYAAAGEKKFVEAAKSSPRMEYFLEFFEGFLAYVKEHDCPLDFFSWHSYASVADTLCHAKYARKRLDEEGFTHTEHTCNEWNCEFTQRGTARHSAVTAAMMLGMQDSSLDSAMFYDARFGVSLYGGLFNPLTAEPFPTYYTFMGFNQLYIRGMQVELQCDNESIYAVAALGESDGYIMISNITDAETLELCMEGYEITDCMVIDDERTWQNCDVPDVLKKNTVLCMTVAKV